MVENLYVIYTCEGEQKMGFGFSIPHQDVTFVGMHHTAVNTKLSSSALRIILF